MSNKRKRKTKSKIRDDIKSREIVNAKINSDINIALVFSCPGKVELKNNCFAFGTTGKNLDLLLKELKGQREDIFPSDKKEDYHINNSSNHVYYKGYKGLSDKRTTPYVEDIKSDENINRLKSELGDKNYVISFGVDAELALETAKIPYLKAKCHLGTKGLNSILENTKEDKIKNIAGDLLSQLKSKD